LIWTHALATLSAALLIPLLRRLPALPALLIAGLCIASILWTLARAISGGRIAGLVIASLFAPSFAWLVWFTHQY
jgi:hypothetical protein